MATKSDVQNGKEPRGEQPRWPADDDAKAARLVVIAKLRREFPNLDVEDVVDERISRPDWPGDVPFREYLLSRARCDALARIALDGSRAAARKRMAVDPSISPLLRKPISSTSATLGPGDDLTEGLEPEYSQDNLPSGLSRRQYVRNCKRGAWKPCRKVDGLWLTSAKVYAAWKASRDGARARGLPPGLTRVLGPQLIRLVDACRPAVFALLQAGNDSGVEEVAEHVARAIHALTLPRHIDVLSGGRTVSRTEAPPIDRRLLSKLPDPWDADGTAWPAFCGRFATRIRKLLQTERGEWTERASLEPAKRRGRPRKGEAVGASRLVVPLADPDGEASRWGRQRADTAAAVVRAGFGLAGMSLTDFNKLVAPERKHDVEDERIDRAVAALHAERAASAPAAKYSSAISHEEEAGWAIPRTPPGASPNYARPEPNLCRVHGRGFRLVCPECAGSNKNDI